MPRFKQGLTFPLNRENLVLWAEEVTFLLSFPFPEWEARKRNPKPNPKLIALGNSCHLFHQFTYMGSSVPNPSYQCLPFHSFLWVSLQLILDKQNSAHKVRKELENPHPTQPSLQVDGLPPAFCLGTQQDPGCVLLVPSKRFPLPASAGVLRHHCRIEKACRSCQVSPCQPACLETCTVRRRGREQQGWPNPALECIWCPHKPCADWGMQLL